MRYGSYVKSRYARRSAASKIQKAWRCRQWKKKYRGRDQIKTAGDVRRAVQKSAPSRGVVNRISQTFSTSPVGVLDCLSEITFSTDDSRQDRRQSMKITMGSFRVRGEVAVADSLVASDASNLVRLMVVRQKNFIQAATFDPSLCFYNDGQSTPLSVYAQVNTRYCEVLWDKTYNLENNTNGDRYPTRPRMVFIDENIPIKKKITYRPMLDGQSELPRDQNHYYFIGVSDSSITPHPSLNGASVTWFKNIE